MLSILIFKARIVVKAQIWFSESTNSTFTTFCYRGKKNLITLVLFFCRRPEEVTHKTLWCSFMTSLMLKQERQRWWHSKLIFQTTPCNKVKPHTDAMSWLRHKEQHLRVPGVYRSTSTVWGAASSSEGLILCFSVSDVVLGTRIGTRDTQAPVKITNLAQVQYWWHRLTPQKTN